MNDLPGIDLRINENGISGVVVFYYQERDAPSRPWHVAAENAVPLLAPQVKGRTLTFEVQHHICHGCSELGPNVKFRVKLIGPDEARLWKLDGENIDKDLGPGMKLMRRDSPPLPDHKR